MNKYTIFTVINQSYQKFGYVFLNSLLKNTDVRKINKVVIADLGLDDEFKKIMKDRFPLVELYDTQQQVHTDKIHSQDWVRSVSQKTKSLLKCLRDECFPIIMMDVDFLFLHRFDDVIDTSYDIQLCKREKINKRKDIKISMKYIASFLIFNNKKNIIFEFIEDWIQEIESMHTKQIKPPHETPAMCKTVYKYRNSIKFGEIDEIIVSANKKCTPETKIVHMKCTPVSNMICSDAGFNERISCIKNVDKHTILSYLH